MSASSVVEFTKMHGAGNDFIVLDNRRWQFDENRLSALGGTWCRRRYGIGADGLLALDAAADADYRMRYINADGSWAAMCGNGARCLARYAVEAGIDGPDVSFRADAGRYHATVRDDDTVRLYVPSPTDLTLNIEVEEPVPDGLDGVHFVHTGTEHLVSFVDDIEAIPVKRWGQRLRENESVLPAGANANFVEVAGDTLHVRTYEKGVEDETLSCGTGVLAAATIAATMDRGPDDEVRVETRGGTLYVGEETTERGAETYLQGPVVRVYTGSILTP